MRKSWQLGRRTFLRGTGLGGAAVALGLPLLDCMLDAPSVANAKEGSRAGVEATLPCRLCAVYFPFGVSLPPKEHEHADWSWFPWKTGRDYEFTKPLSSLEEFRDHVTILGGLSHPAGRKLGGHDTGDTFLTASDLHGGAGTSHYQNSISIDQLAAKHLGEATRFASLTLSSDGGVGEPTRATTISFSEAGRPIPALANPKQIFRRLFGSDSGARETTARRELENTASILDVVLEHSKSIERKLGARDRRKLDEYLDSVRAVEQRVERSQRWLKVPKPNVDPGSVDLDASPEGPKEYIRAMYDLLFLAFQTDTTRVATYMLGQVAGATTIANSFPACIGLKGNWHGLAHGAGKKGGFENLGRFDQFLAEQFAYFLGRLAGTREGDRSLLDSTVLLYGSSNSKTHNNRNYPLVVAGGQKLGLRHGSYRRLDEKTPLSNLFVTLLERVGAPVESFADSTGKLSEILEG